jgi:DNA repair exonuclease SbcCD ATPase subunit
MTATINTERTDKHLEGRENVAAELARVQAQLAEANQAAVTAAHDEKEYAAASQRCADLAGQASRLKQRLDRLEELNSVVSQEQVPYLIAMMGIDIVEAAEMAGQVRLRLNVRNIFIDGKQRASAVRMNAELNLLDRIRADAQSELDSAQSRILSLKTVRKIHELIQSRRAVLSGADSAKMFDEMEDLFAKEYSMSQVANRHPLLSDGKPIEKLIAERERITTKLDEVRARISKLCTQLGEIATTIREELDGCAIK